MAANAIFSPDRALRRGCEDLKLPVSSLIGVGAAMKYRADIDGLRAVAIVPILLFHAGVGALRGGFVGVDIFFVISGFLITGIIVSEMDEGHFSIVDFYHRRVARIFPALFGMLLILLVLGCMLLLPDEVEQLCQSAASAAAFVSNFYFWGHTDYFDVASESKILLHTWSLGVEEQFYIFYPLILLALRRFWPKRLRFGIMAIGLASFALSMAVQLHNPETAFYLLPTRAWELALGGLVALQAFPKAPSQSWRDVLSLGGLGMILVGLVAIKAGRLFPAPEALLPCGGTALLIAYGRDAITARWLSLAVCRWIGRISYSLYLWHWPIITFYRLYNGRNLHPSETVLLCLASLVAAEFSNRFIERPCLRWFRPRPAKPVVAGGAAALVCIVAVSFGVASNASSWRAIDPAILHVASYARYITGPERAYQFRQGVCFATSAEAIPDSDGCLKFSPTRRNVIVLGDSHAAQYWRAISERFPRVNVMQATASGCYPLLETDGKGRCTDLMNKVLGPVVDAGHVDGIVLIARWSRRTVAPLLATIHYLVGKHISVVVLGPTVEYDGEFPSLLARAMIAGHPESVAQMRLDERRELDQKLAPLVRASGATYVSVEKAECPGGRCRLLAPDGSPMHFDYGHLTLSASRLLAKAIPAI